MSNISRIRVTLFIYIILQSSIIVTWLPVSRGELNHIFRAVGAVPFSIPYADFKVIASGIQYYQEGGDPYHSRDFDFRGRYYNYLPFWLHIPFLGLEQENIKYVYLAFASLFAMGVSLIFWKDKTKHWYAYLPFIYSPPVLLCLERCNYELIVFFTVVLSIWICRKSTGYLRDGLAGGVMLLATCLKLFPVFGFYIFVRRNIKRSLLLLVPFALLTLLYVIINKPYIELVHENTPWSPYISFGVPVLPHNIAMAIDKSSVMLPAYFVLLAWVLVAICFIIGYKLARVGLPESLMESYEAKLFRGTIAIFIGCYLLGGNFDYRLIFLIPSLPFIFRLLREATIPKWIPSSFLALMFVAMWLTEANILFRDDARLFYPVLYINEVCCWLLFTLSIYFQFRLLPNFVRKMIYPNAEALPKAQLAD